MVFVVCQLHIKYDDGHEHVVTMHTRVLKAHLNRTNVGNPKTGSKCSDNHALVRASASKNWVGKTMTESQYFFSAISRNNSKARLKLRTTIFMMLKQCSPPGYPDPWPAQHEV
jgi:hypothetical protein